MNTAQNSEDIRQLTKHWRNPTYDVTVIVPNIEGGAHPQHEAAKLAKAAKLVLGPIAPIEVSQRNLGKYNRMSAAPHFSLEGIALTMSFTDAGSARAAARTIHEEKPGFKLGITMQDGRPSSQILPIAIPYDQFINR